MALQIAVLLLLGSICIGFSAAEIVVDCCLTVVEKPMPLKLLASYIIQEAGKGCDISATTFITKIGRTLCVSHPSDKTWVRNYIKYLDEKKERTQ